MAGGAAQRVGVCRGQGQPRPGRVDGGLPPHPLRSHQHPERSPGAAVQARCPHRLSGGDRPAVPVQVSLLRTLPQERDRSEKMCAAIRADYTAEVEGNV